MCPSTILKVRITWRNIVGKIVELGWILFKKSGEEVFSKLVVLDFVLMTFFLVLGKGKYAEKFETYF
jgi:hypothetical protein